MKQEEIFNNLVLFNNSMASKKEWEIILRGCGAPKNMYFWKALRDNCLFKYKHIYKLQDLNLDIFHKIWNEYCVNNRASVKRSTELKKRKAKIAKQLSEIDLKPVSMVNGCVMLYNDYDFK